MAARLVYSSGGKNNATSPSQGNTRASARMEEDTLAPEKESYTWTVLHPANWRKEANFGWRFAASELAKRKKPASPEKRPRQQ